MLKCTSCQELKSSSDFYLKQGRIRFPCKKCINRSSLEWKRRNSEKCRTDRHRHYLRHKEKEIGSALTYHYRSKYGLTPEKHKQMFVDQKYKCAVCGVPDSSLTRQLHVDHNHKTGRVRGLLCHICNTVVVRTVENFNSLIPLAVKYLEDYND